jgi:hypothetical protein
VDDFHLVSWHTAVMIPACLPDLDGLHPEALKALVLATHSESMEQHKELTSSTHEIRTSEAGYREVPPHDLRPEE